MKSNTLLLTIASAIAFTAGAQAQGAKLVIKGSDTLGAKLVPQLAEAYKVKNPGTTFEIAAEGSTTGIAAVIDGTAQIGMSSREAKATEESGAKVKGVTLTATIVTYDGIAVVVNEANPIKDLKKDVVEKIFTGDVTDWSAAGGKGGKVSIYTRNTSSGTYGDFKELAMKKREYAPSSQKMAGNEQIAQEVSKNPNGVGYVGLAYTKSPGLKVVTIDGVELTEEMVRAKKYPYSRPTFFFTNGPAQGEAKKFLDFALSEEGQKIAKQVGFVTVK